MRRVHIHIDESVDDRLVAEAARRGVSKASLIRNALEREYGTHAKPDPIDDLIGVFDGEPSANIDSAVYGRHRTRG